MMWVRYPNGQCIQYNKANYFIHTNAGDWQLLTRKDGDLICRIQASAGAIVEFERACSTHNPLNNDFDQRRIVADLVSMARQLRLALKDVKKKK